MAEVCIAGAMRTTPSEALDAILNIPPIRQISIEMSTLAAIRLRDLDYWKDHLTGHSSILLKNNNIPPKTDYCMPTEHMTTPFHTLIPNRDEWTSTTPGQEGAPSFYTDGSKLNNQNSLVGRVARQTWPHIDKARSNALCYLSRGDCSLVIRSLNGHWLIGIHAQRLNSPYNDFCRSCWDEEEEESPEYFFCFCPALSSRRFRFLGKPFLDGLGDLASLSPPPNLLMLSNSGYCDRCLSIAAASASQRHLECRLDKQQRWAVSDAAVNEIKTSWESKLSGDA
ncbi:hypothetical protein ACLKA7_001563 [Drosophila subpalustris]